MVTDISVRMKGYEKAARTFLEAKKPVIVRLDGRAFHTYTKGIEKPFDDVMVGAMMETTKKLCERVSGVLFGYSQSDEITLVLGDWQKEDTQPFFNNNIQKIVSITASMATLYFNKAFAELVTEKEKRVEVDEKVKAAYARNIEHGANFDSRCFNLPFEEVVNCLIWREQDAIRNSIQAMAQSFFSHKQLDKKNTQMQKEMMREEKGVIWEDIAINLQRGFVCKRVQVEEDIVVNIRGREEKKHITRDRWVIDKEIPLFWEDKGYIEKYL